MSTYSYVVKELTVDLDGSTYECEVTQVGMTPTAPTQTTATACPDGAQTDVGPATWTFEVTANTTSGLAPAGTSLFDLLMDPTNYATPAVVTFCPDPINAPTKGWELDVRLIPPTSTWPVGDWATYTVSLPVLGSPRPVTIAAARSEDLEADANAELADA